MNLAGSKVVARYRDGRLVKGLTYDFQVGRTRLHIFPAAGTGGAASVDVGELKAVFFVRDLVGNPRYHERHTFPEGPARAVAGARVAVAFVDGEILVGTVEAGSWSAAGLVLVPADPKSNNIRVYVVSTAVKSVSPLPVEAPPRRAVTQRSEVTLRRTPSLARPRTRWLPGPVLSWLSRPATG